MSITDIIEFYTRERGYPPTVREVAAMKGLSVTVTHGQLVRLRAAGMVFWEDGQPRTLRLSA